MDAGLLYQKYHISRQDERLGLFESVRSEFGVQTGLYPGCFVHVTPSFIIPHMFYADSDGNARRFFSHGAAERLVAERRLYPEPARIEFFYQDYQERLPLAQGSVELLISQYAGFVSEACKRYLACGGYLIVNNSHGDAGLAWCDPDFTLVAVVQRRGERWSLSTRSLEEYFIPASPIVPGEAKAMAEYIRGRGRGIGYTKTASDYVFEKVNQGWSRVGETYVTSGNGSVLDGVSASPGGTRALRGADMFCDAHIGLRNGAITTSRGSTDERAIGRVAGYPKAGKPGKRAGTILNAGHVTATACVAGRKRSELASWIGLCRRR